MEKVALNPSRYIGIFRPTKPKAKILQNLLQSHEIRFGDAFEKLIGEYLALAGFSNLPKKIKINEDNLSLDQFFKKGKKYYFVEQKVRDDHDSSKKRGQINNFAKKLSVLVATYGEENVSGYFYFIDPELAKNNKYYQTELKKMGTDYGVNLALCYGEELFKDLGMGKEWLEILEFLKKWKHDIPDLPEINFDKDAQSSFDEIKDLTPAVFRKLFANTEIYNSIVLTIFPDKKVLNLLLNHFEELSADSKIYKTLHEALETKIKTK